MSKELVISIILIMLGFIFECLHFTTDLTLFEIKFWILGIGCIILGSLGLVWYGLIPFLGKGAEKLGKHGEDKSNN